MAEKETAGEANQSPAPGEEYRNMSPEAFKSRLESERLAGTKAALKALGLTNLEEAKLAIENAKKVEAEKLSEIERYKKRVEELEPVSKKLSADNETLKSALEKVAEDAFRQLPESFQKYIATIAGDDAVTRLNAINAAREAGVLPAAKPKATVSEETPAPEKKREVKPATTIAPKGPTAPKPAGTASHYQIWKDLQESGKAIQAALYRKTHSRAIAAEESSES